MLICLIALFVLGYVVSAEAAAVRIVALGGSPAQLQSMLRQQGYDAQVKNAGISGDTAPACCAGFRRQWPRARRSSSSIRNNDIKACTEPWRPQKCATPAEHNAQVAAIASQLRARGIKVFMANIEFGSIPIADWQADRRHMTPEGHLEIRRYAPTA